MVALNHITIKTNFPGQAIDWEKICHNLAINLGMTVVDSKFHYFKPRGLTGFLLLAESHLALHTWPEQNLSLFEITSCKKLPQDAEKQIRQILKDFEIRSLKIEGETSFVERPKPKREFDQFYATTETVSKRVAKFSERDNLKGHRFLFLGDDDLDSIATARTGLTSEVTVLDIDNDILGVIQKTSHLENLKINLQKYDAKLPLPNNYQGQFDVAFSDPPYTPQGFGTFLARLDKATTKEATIYMCYGYTQKELWRPLKIQKLLSDWGFFISEKIEDFNEYTGAKSISNKSALYILKKTPQTKVNEKLLTGGFYTND